MSVPTAYIRQPLEYQFPMWMSQARFKLAHHGRRWGKDGVALPSALTGHGGPDPWEHPKWKGVGHGFSVAWIVRDFPQASGLWVEQIIPRFASLRPTVSTNKNEMTVTLPNGGRLFICSVENIESTRGLGASMAGVVINEAAHLDLEHVWGRVIRPILVDNRGWGILASTPNAGSYFNALCERTEAGDPDLVAEGWASFGGDARENPTISPEEFKLWVNSTYIEGSREEQEEAYGKLVAGGSRLAFPMFYLPVHAPKSMEEWMPPPHWHTFMGVDWATTGQAAAYLMSHNGRNQVACLREFVWTGKDGYEAGYDLAEAVLGTPLTRWPDTCWVDDAMGAQTGIGGTTILAEFQRGIDDCLKQTNTPALPCLPAPKGPGSRKRRYDALRHLLSWEEQPREPGAPRTVKRGPRLKINPKYCPILCRTLPKLKTLSKKKGEHTWTEDCVDPDQPNDDFYDALTYGLIAAFPPTEQPQESIPVDTHPGFLRSGKRRSRDRSPEVVLQEEMADMEHALRQSGYESNGYGRIAR